MADEETSDRSDLRNVSEEELDQRIAVQVARAFENNMPSFTAEIQSIVSAAYEAERNARAIEGGSP